MNMKIEVRSPKSEVPICVSAASQEHRPPARREPASFSRRAGPEAGAPRLRRLAVLFATWAVGCLAAPAASGGNQVQLIQQPERVLVQVAGQPFTEYWFTNVPRPFCYPIHGPGGVGMTRDYPMRDRAGEDRDHPHHRGLWFTHGDVNGVDFWSETPKAGKIIHDGFLEVASGQDTGVLRTRNRWVAIDGRQICTDERTLRFYADPANARRMDFEITLFAGSEPLVFGDTKEGSMAIRVAESMRLTPMKQPGQSKAAPGEGHIVLSTGQRDQDTWGKRAPWCSYYGPVDGRTVGVAIFEHPGNPRFPTWWHVRDYGLFAANPFGQHDFEKLSDKQAGNLVVPAGGKVTFRYRFYFHAGDATRGKVAERFEEYRAGNAAAR